MPPASTVDRLMHSDVLPVIVVSSDAEAAGPAVILASSGSGCPLSSTHRV